MACIIRRAETRQICHLDIDASRKVCFDKAKYTYEQCMKKGFAYIDEPHVRKVVEGETLATETVIESSPDDKIVFDDELKKLGELDKGEPLVSPIVTVKRKVI